MSEKIAVASIEHGSRPAVYLILGLGLIIWLFSVREPLFQILVAGETTLKVGDFELSLRATANKTGLADELTSLQSLDSAQLQLFLVIGKESRPIQYHGEEVNEENLLKLKEAGLIVDYRKNEKGGFQWVVSQKAHRLHDIIFNQVTKSIKRTPAA